MRVLCGPLRISAISALKWLLNAGIAEIRRGPQRKAPSLGALHSFIQRQSKKQSYSDCHRADHSQQLKIPIRLYELIKGPMRVRFPGLPAVSVMCSGVVQADRDDL